MQHTTEAAKQYQCRHIFTDGRRCSSPCLRGEEFCYYHHTTRRPVANPRRRRSRCSTFHLPLPEDRSAIQASIGEVLQRIASNDIDPRRAGLLLYGLQIASLNLPKPQPAQRNAKPEPVETVEEITIDPDLGVLAPRAEVGQATQRKSSVTLLIEKMLREKEEEKEKEKEEKEAAISPEPLTIPTLHATAGSSFPNRQKRWGMGASLFACFSFCQPSSAQRLHRDAGQVRLDIENGRSIEHVDASNVQVSVLAAKQLDDGKTNGVRPTGRSSGKHAVRSIVERRCADQIEVTGSIELPDDEQMGETLDVGEPGLELRQNLEHTFCLVFRVKPLRNLRGSLVGAAHKSNRLGNKHISPCLPLPS
jgi:hypothetical protein